MSKSEMNIKLNNIGRTIINVLNECIHSWDMSVVPIQEEQIILRILEVDDNDQLPGASMGLNIGLYLRNDVPERLSTSLNAALAFNGLNPSTHSQPYSEGFTHVTLIPGDDLDKLLKIVSKRNLSTEMTKRPKTPESIKLTAGGTATSVRVVIEAPVLMQVVLSESLQAVLREEDLKIDVDETAASTMVNINGTSAKQIYSEAMRNVQNIARIVYSSIVSGQERKIDDFATQEMLRTVTQNVRRNMANRGESLGDGQTP